MPLRTDRAREPLFRQQKGKHRGEPIHESTVRNWLQRSCIATGLPMMRVHQLRSSFVNQLRREQADVAVIAATVGHASSRTTAEHYVEAVPIEVLDVLKRRPE